MVGWNRDKIQCRVLHTFDQSMLCLVEVISNKERNFCSFIHAETVGSLRRSLWADLCAYKSICNKNPWVLLGDVNVSLNIDDHPEGISHKTQDIEEFQDCVNNLKIKDISSTGLHYTWTKSLLNPSFSVLKKIDRVMGNEELCDVHRRAHVVFLPYGISDYSPAVLTCSKSLKSTNRSFRGIAILKEHPIALEDEEKLMFQRAKVEWLIDGDRNLLTFISQDANDMIGDVSNDEIKAAMYSIDDINAPGPNGYTLKFFKRAWHIIGEDVCDAVKGIL
nr:RNA-directed DNA polymerase, eukaryota, reverse transcriptase zinc-binding domain protein [Tanacetum cinerariifolium]